MNTELGQLTGTEKQINWANDIRDKAIAKYAKWQGWSKMERSDAYYRMSEECRDKSLAAKAEAQGDREDKGLRLENEAELWQQVLLQTDAHWWITRDGHNIAELLMTVTEN